MAAERGVVRMLPGRWNNMLAFGVAPAILEARVPGSLPWTNPKSTSSPGNEKLDPFTALGFIHYTGQP